MTSAPTPATGQGQPRTLVALLAHADDESAASPVLARYAREGVRVYLIVASDGSAGSAAETLQRLLPAQARVLNGEVAFIPATVMAQTNDLFR